MSIHETLFRLLTKDFIAQRPTVAALRMFCDFYSFTYEKADTKFYFVQSSPFLSKWHDIQETFQEIFGLCFGSVMKRSVSLSDLWICQIWDSLT